ncbi:MAG: Fur family transcriptional regulator [Symbiobacteriia bacterium]
MTLKQARQHLAALRQRQTPQRTAILRTLMESKHPLTAQEVAGKVRVTYPHISLDTIYRNLTMLRDAGLVNQVNLQNREAARFEFQAEGQHHHHFICLGCGKTFCVDSCDLPLLKELPREDPGFRVVGHAFEVYGFCSRCQSS